ncbi:MAG: glgC 1, partial [Bacteroidetes bacterium]|nr:glgC 1 [Bacteroidota bacterium]
MKETSPSDQYLEPELVRQVRERAKSMIEVGVKRKPFLDYLLHNVSSAGYRNVVIVAGERDEFVREYYEKGEGGRQWTNLELSFAVQRIPPGRSKPLGAADALFRALKATPSWQGQKFTVCNSDNLYSVRALRLLLEDDHENALIDYERSALKFDHERIMQFAVIEKESD